MERLKSILARLHLLGVARYPWRKYYYLRHVVAPMAKRVMACRWRYAKVLRRIRRMPKDRKIRVLFIVNEIAKFKCQKVYEAMEKSGVFEPIIALSAWNQQSESLCSDDRLDIVFANAEKFFDSLGDRHVRTVKTHPRRVSDLSEFKPDIVFNCEQWIPCGEQDTEHVSRFALTCYVSYFVPNYGDHFTDCLQPVQMFSFYYFTLNKYLSGFLRIPYRWWNAVVRFKVTGHPAIDFYNRGRYAVQKRNRVVYAPHFSFPHGKHDCLFFLWSTFLWNGEAILEYAKNHPEIEWVFKPHPILRDDLVRTGAWTKEKVDAYYDEWERVGEVNYASDYQELFLSSKAMITDCGSFLTEYAATGSPVIHLLCPENHLVAMPPSKMIYDTFYDVHNLDEMYETFKTVIERDEDPNRDRRIAAVTKAGLMNSTAADNIVSELRKLVRR